MYKQNGISTQWPTSLGASEAAGAATVELDRPKVLVPNRRVATPPDASGHGRHVEPEVLRQHARRIAERRAHETYVGPDSYVNLIAVSPGEAFITWSLPPTWLEEVARREQGRSPGRLTIRLYDVSLILFNGFNAHRMRDVFVEVPRGEGLFPWPFAGTVQIAEIGVLFPSGEFVPAARSPAVAFAPSAPSADQGCSALYVDDSLAPEPVASPWQGADYLRERGKPKLRANVRIALLCFEASAAGHQTPVGTFVSSMADALSSSGCGAEVFVATRDHRADFEVNGVPYHPLSVEGATGPVDAALAFARALEARLVELPDFDLFHMQDWMTGLAPWLGTRAAVLAMTSLERTRRSESPITPASLEIERLEREVARSVDCVLVPDWLRELTVGSLGIDPTRVHPFSLDGRPADEWSAPLDHGAVKAKVGLGASDRMLLFVGPLEDGAGPDLLLEALPTVLSRTPSARTVFVGSGGMRDRLAGRARQLGVEHAVRLLGHLDLPALVPLLRASEALLLPSRRRVDNDDAVIGLARRAGRAVLSTHAGPTHAIQHERDGLLVYDCPPSVVWGMSRLLEDSRHTEEMGRNGSSSSAGASWSALARAYADLCAEVFWELSEAGQAEKTHRTRDGGRN